MSDDIDGSLLSRLEALRGGNGTREKPASNPIKFDVIERARAPTKRDMLAARLENLRSQPHSPITPASAQTTPTTLHAAKSKTQKHTSGGTGPEKKARGSQDDVDALFETDDNALEEMLADFGTSDPDPKDRHVPALLEQLSAQIPKDPDQKDTKQAADSDDSDGDKMRREVDDVIARFKDEMALEAQDAEDEGQEAPDEGETNEYTADMKLPSVPTNLDIGTDTWQKPQGIDDITARLAALRASTAAEHGLPSVPTSKPSKRANRLTSRTNYTDGDVDSWCTVCLDDATLRCLGCDGDVYCARCWREMHVGPAAAWDERSHRAVQFTRDRKHEKKVALGA
ncbi:zinc finger, FYVE domain containing protein [Metarhizium album ARSEF 1941]|uniref:Zinc finger, FYVE domain containing protein n=1 Tax=Metarhizium album (strain ARSEF 1941) TaxID=1081103 RepID=A0A0B2WNJ6_METAS|nr:zinc finger, FYVE domain containing protein [Metarhizium album ARSEF 1941]KHN94575.1 zinc finger, FYVE domain containing protein [Metarhizium album ARSEF 1941]